VAGVGLAIAVESEVVPVPEIEAGSAIAAESVVAVGSAVESAAEPGPVVEAVVEPGVVVVAEPESVVAVAGD